MNDTSSSPAQEVDWRDTVTWYTYETTFTKLVKVVGGIFFGLLADVECVGQDNVPANGPCILAANHISLFDVIYMGLHLPRHPHFMAKRELYKNPAFGWMFRLFGAFPVNRGENDAWALRQAGRVLAANQILCMFPEGTRSGRQAQLKRGKTGTVRLALEHRVPVVPVAIIGTQNFRYSWPRINKVRIEIGQPLDLEPMAGPPPYKQETLRKLTTLLMQQIAVMLPPAHRGVYA